MAVRRRPAGGAPGQHFLRSSRLATQLVREARVGRGDLVVDIGAGTGALTRALADAGARVTALELDAALADGLRRRFSGGRVDVVEADARRWTWPDEGFAVVANLPFSGSGEILSSLLRNPSTPLERAELIVQWELAAKHSRVWPTTLRGVYWRAWFELSIVGRLSRYAFSPQPDVDAAVLRVTRRSQPRVAPEQHTPYWRFLAEAFRRPSVSVALRGRMTPRELRRQASLLGFDHASHPRDLDARQWAGVFAFAQARSPRSARPTGSGR